MRAEALIRLKLPSKNRLEIVFRALKPEVEKPASPRSKASIEKDGAFLVLKVEAKDTVALRAALNAYLRWIGSIMDALAVLKGVS